MIFSGELFSVLLSVSMLVSQSHCYDVIMLLDTELLPRLSVATVLVSFEQEFDQDSDIRRSTSMWAIEVLHFGTRSLSSGCFPLQLVFAYPL